MKKFASVVAIAAALVLGITACDEEDQATRPVSASQAEAASPESAPETTTVKTTTPTTTTPALSEEEATDLAFIAVLDDRGIEYSSEEQAIEVAHSVCTALAAGATFADLIVAAGDVYSMEDTGFIIGASIGGYCPEFASAIPS